MVRVILVDERVRRIVERNRDRASHCARQRGKCAGAGDDLVQRHVRRDEALGARFGILLQQCFRGADAGVISRRPESM